MHTYGGPEFIQIGKSRVYVDRAGWVPAGAMDYRGYLQPGTSQATSVTEALQQYQRVAQLVLAELRADPKTVVVCPNIWSQLTPLLNVG